MQRYKITAGRRKQHARRVRSPPQICGLAIAWRFSGDLAVKVDGLPKGGARLFPFGRSDILTTRSPELLDAADAPKGALARGANRSASHKHVDGIRVQLWKVPERDPTASLDFHGELQLMDLAIGLNFSRRHRMSIHDEFY